MKLYRNILAIIIGVTLFLSGCQSEVTKELLLNPSFSYSLNFHNCQGIGQYSDSMLIYASTKNWRNDHPNELCTYYVDSKKNTLEELYCEEGFYDFDPLDEYVLDLNRKDIKKVISKFDSHGRGLRTNTRLEFYGNENKLLGQYFLTKLDNRVITYLHADSNYLYVVILNKDVQKDRSEWIYIYDLQNIEREIEKE